MATVDTNVINPGGGGDYTSLTAWESAEATNCVSADIIAEAECTGSTADTSSLTISAGWTTDATRFIRIKQASSDAHGMEWSTSKYRLAPSANHAILSSNDDFLVVDGLQIKAASTSSTTTVRACGNTTSGTVVVVKNCLVDGSDAAEYTYGMDDYGMGGEYNCYNNTVYNFDASNGYGIAVRWYGGDWHLYNNTVVDCTVGIKVIVASPSVDARLINNLCNGNTTDYDVTGGTSNVTSNSNVSEDSSAFGTNAVTSHAVTFENEASDIFRLGSGEGTGSGYARDNGVDLSSDTYAPFSVDAVGNSRPSGSWDIGAHEYTSIDITMSAPTLTFAPQDFTLSLGALIKAMGFVGIVASTGTLSVVYTIPREAPALPSPESTGTVRRGGVRERRVFPGRISDPAVREELMKLQNVNEQLAYLRKVLEPGPAEGTDDQTATRTPGTSEYYARTLQSPAARTGPRIPKRDLDERITGDWTFENLAAETVSVSTTLTADDITVGDVVANGMQVAGDLSVMGDLTLARELHSSLGKVIDRYGLLYFVVRRVVTATVLHAADTPHILVCAGSGGYTVTLPPVNVITVGLMLTVKNRSSGSITIDGWGSQTIDGSTTTSLSSSGNAVTIAAVSATSDHWIKTSEM